MVKICNRCKIEKKLDEFYSHAQCKMGVSPKCKVCMTELFNYYRRNNKDVINAKCRVYYKKNKESVLVRTKKYRNDNLEKNKLILKNWYIKNKESVSKKQKEYYENNKRDCLNRTKKRHSERLKTDPAYKLRTVLRDRIYSFLKRKGLSKRRATVAILGADVKSVKLYLENKFAEGMSWSNHGRNGWHIDHIIPLSSAKTEEGMLKLCHYTNLQPLWAKDNLKKSAKNLT